MPQHISEKDMKKRVEDAGAMPLVRARQEFREAKEREAWAVAYFELVKEEWREARKHRPDGAESVTEVGKCWYCYQPINVRRVVASWAGILHLEISGNCEHVEMSGGPHVITVRIVEKIGADRVSGEEG